MTVSNETKNRLVTEYNGVWTDILDTREMLFDDFLTLIEDGKLYDHRYVIFPSVMAQTIALPALYKRSKPGNFLIVLRPSLSMDHLNNTREKSYSEIKPKYFTICRTIGVVDHIAEYMQMPPSSDFNITVLIPSGSKSIPSSATALVSLRKNPNVKLIEDCTEDDVLFQMSQHDVYVAVDENECMFPFDAVNASMRGCIYIGSMSGTVSEYLTDINDDMAYCMKTTFRDTTISRTNSILSMEVLAESRSSELEMLSKHVTRQARGMFSPDLVEERLNRFLEAIEHHEKVEAALRALHQDPAASGSTLN